MPGQVALHYSRTMDTLEAEAFIDVESMFQEWMEEFTGQRMVMINKMLKQQQAMQEAQNAAQ